MKDFTQLKNRRYLFENVKTNKGRKIEVYIGN